MKACFLFIIVPLALPAVARAAEVAPPPKVVCTGEPDKTKPIPPAGSGRATVCAIDLGSNSAKLQVLSLEPGQPLSFRDERQCRARLGFGAIVFDSKTGERKPLPAPETTRLIDVMKELQGICALDGGRMVGAEATQWSRDTTNIDEVRAAVKAATGLEFETLTPEWEGHFGYVAATRNTPGRFALDPGSNSFQIAWWPKGAPVARTISVPLGYVRGARAHYAADAEGTFAAARARHAEDLRRRLDEALGILDPPVSLAQLKTEVRRGTLSSEVFVTGQDGALDLAIRGRLRDADGAWISTAPAYESMVAGEGTVHDERFGEVLALVKPGEIAKFLEEVEAPAFDALRRDPIRSLYGEKTLANAVLLDLLARELGVETVVLVPQEMPAGYILFKLTPKI
jgi:hypothetical protein